MSKARHPIDNNTPAAGACNIIKFEQVSGLHQDQSKNETAMLRAEVQALRLELTKAQRTIAHYEILLQNALIREHEIRARLVR